MVDETTDISNTEQLVVCLHYVDKNLDVLEEIVGYYSMESTTSTVIVTHNYRCIVAHEFEH